MFFASSLSRAAQIRGDQLALICDDRRFDWRTFHYRVSRLAAGLSRSGVLPGDRIALLTANGDHTFTLFHAIAWMGAVVVPLNSRWAQREMIEAIEDCRPALLISDEAFQPVAEAISAAASIPLMLAHHDCATFRSIERMICDYDAVPSVVRNDTDILAMFYTGGTTGRSKGVMLSERNIAFNALSNIAEGLLGADQTYLHASPAFHIAGASAIYGVVVSAATSVVLPRFDAAEILRVIQTEHCTETLLVPTMIQMILDHPDLAQSNLTGLRRINYGAAPISEALLDRAQAAWPGVSFTQLYGMTELSPVCAVLHDEDHGPIGRAKGRHRAAGRAAFGVELAIVGADDKPVAPRQVGEIVTRGPNVMLGYWDRPEETAEALRGGWMHTGDVGFMDEDGYVYVVDRVKDMIVSGGENVFSIEVENILAQHPSVQQCAVFGVPHEHWGEQVHGVVVIREGHELDATTLDLWCRGKLANFKVPRSFVLRREPLPISGAGKVLKRDLRQPYWDENKRQIS